LRPNWTNIEKDHGKEENQQMERPLILELLHNRNL
jgi:hypothetical protein